MKLSSIIVKPFIFVYKYAISPLLGAPCRFQPTCSCYAEEAFEKHNFIRASWLTLWRLLRCNPWGGHGYDPVPEPTKPSDKL